MEPVVRPGYVLIVSTPLVGHPNPLLIQAAEMARRGWRATIATTSEGMRHLDRRGPGVDAGVGIRLDKHRVIAAGIRGALAGMLRDASYLPRIAAVQSSFALAGGVRRAADLIEHVAHVGVEHYRARE